MFHSSGYFKAVTCPYYASGLCERPYCHFRHVKPTVDEKVTAGDYWTSTLPPSSAITASSSPSGSLLAKVGETIQKLQRDIERDQQLLSGHKSTKSGIKTIEKFAGNVAEKYQGRVTLSDAKSPKKSPSRAEAPCSYKPTPIAELKKKKKSIEQETDVSQNTETEAQATRKRNLPDDVSKEETVAEEVAAECQPTPNKKARIDDDDDDEPVGNFSDAEDSQSDSSKSDTEKSRDDTKSSDKGQKIEPETLQEKPKEVEKVEEKPLDPNDFVSQILQDSSKSLALNQVKHKKDGSIVIFEKKAAKKKKKKELKPEEIPTAADLHLELSDEDDDNEPIEDIKVEDNAVSIEEPEKKSPIKKPVEKEECPPISNAEIELAKKRESVWEKIRSGSIVLGHIPRDDETLIDSTKKKSDNEKSPKAKVIETEKENLKPKGSPKTKKDDSEKSDESESSSSDSDRDRKKHKRKRKKHRRSESKESHRKKRHQKHKKHRKKKRRKHKKHRSESESESDDESLVSGDDSKSNTVKSSDESQSTVSDKSKSSRRKSRRKRKRKHSSGRSESESESDEDEKVSDEELTKLTDKSGKETSDKESKSRRKKSRREKRKRKHSSDDNESESESENSVVKGEKAVSDKESKSRRKKSRHEKRKHSADDSESESESDDNRDEKLASDKDSSKSRRKKSHREKRKGKHSSDDKENRIDSDSGSERGEKELEESSRVQKSSSNTKENQPNTVKGVEAELISEQTIKSPKTGSPRVAPDLENKTLVKSPKFELSDKENSKSKPFVIKSEDVPIKTHENDEEVSKSVDENVPDPVIKKESKPRDHKPRSDKPRDHESRSDKPRDHESRSDKPRDHESRSDRPRDHESLSDKRSDGRRSSSDRRKSDDRRSSSDKRSKSTDERRHSDDKRPKSHEKEKSKNTSESSAKHSHDKSRHSSSRQDSGKSKHSNDGEKSSEKFHEKPESSDAKASISGGKVVPEESAAEKLIRLPAPAVRGEFNIFNVLNDDDLSDHSDKQSKPATKTNKKSHSSSSGKSSNSSSHEKKNEKRSKSHSRSSSHSKSRHESHKSSRDHKSTSKVREGHSENKKDHSSHKSKDRHSHESKDRHSHESKDRHSHESKDRHSHDSKDGHSHSKPSSSHTSSKTSKTPALKSPEKSSVAAQKSPIAKQKPEILGSLFGNDSDSDSSSDIIMINSDSSPVKIPSKKSSTKSVEKVAPPVVKPDQKVDDDLDDSFEAANAVDWDEDPFDGNADQPNAADSELVNPYRIPKKRVAQPQAAQSRPPACRPLSMSKKTFLSPQEQMYNRFKMVEQRKQAATSSGSAASTTDFQSLDSAGSSKTRIAHTAKWKTGSSGASGRTGKGLPSGKAEKPEPKKELVRPLIPSEFGSKVPTSIRQRYLNQLIDECVSIYDDQQDAFDRALAEEKTIYERSTSRVVYLNVAVKAIRQIRAEIAEIKGGPSSSSGGTKAPLNKTWSHEAVLGGSKAAKISFTLHRSGYGSIKAPEEVKLTSGIFWKYLQQYILTEDQLKENGFPMVDPADEEKVKFYAVDDSTPTKGLKMHEKVCCRCGKRFRVYPDGTYATKEECNYHWGRAYKRKISGSWDSRYNCCSGDLNSEPCCSAKLHVHDTNKRTDLSGYVTTYARPARPDGSGVFALDCEMVYTVIGCELARLTVIDMDMKCVYETLVKPEGEVVDYNTRFSGLEEGSLKSVKTTLQDVQAKLRRMFSDKTILLGHSLESDFTAMKLVHHTVVDTSVVFPHRLGPPYKRALKTLMGEILKKIIQNDVGGHDSHEDAAACMELMIWKVKEELRVKH